MLDRSEAHQGATGDNSAVHRGEAVAAGVVHQAKGRLRQGAHDPKEGAVRRHRKSQVTEVKLIVGIHRGRS